MKLSKIFAAILYFGVGFCIGGCKILEMNPFGIGFVCASGMCGQNALWAYAGALLGAVGVYAPWNVVYYSVIMLGVVWMSSCRKLQVLSCKEWIIPGLAGVFTSVVNVLSCYFLPIGRPLAYGILEGLLVFSLAYIFCRSIQILREDYMCILQDGQAFLAVLTLLLVVIYGAPELVLGKVAFAETLGILSVMIIVYKFGLAVGISWTALCGMILSYRLEDIEIVYAWILLVLLSFGVCTMLHMGRYLYGISYAVVYFLLGKFYSKGLLDETSIKAVVSALFLFFLLPSRFLLQVDGLKVEGLEENQQEWGKLVIERMKNLANAFQRIDYTFAVEGNAGIGFRQVGNMLHQFTSQLEEQVPLKKTAEAGILENLGNLGIQVKSLSLLKSHHGQYQLYLSARVRRGCLVGAESVRKIISNELALPMELTEESRQLVGRNYDLICLRQKPTYRLMTAARNLSCYENVVSGDNFYIGDILHGKKLIMVADGMGNGLQAAADSSLLLETLEELLSAGFDQELSVRVVNSYLASKNRGEHFATLDLLLLDTYTGYGQLMKHGAATTYIKRGRWIECLKSTSLPVGVAEDADVEICGKKFYHGDLIVLMSDGVLESIMFENKDDFMREILSRMEEDEPEYIVEEIVGEIQKVCGKRLRDDATVVACKLVKTL